MNTPDTYVSEAAPGSMPVSVLEYALTSYQFLDPSSAHGKKIRAQVESVREDQTRARLEQVLTHLENARR